MEAPADWQPPQESPAWVARRLRRGAPEPARPVVAGELLPVQPAQPRVESLVPVVTAVPVELGPVGLEWAVTVLPAALVLPGPQGRRWVLVARPAPEWLVAAAHSHSAARRARPEQDQPRVPRVRPGWGQPEALRAVAGVQARVELAASRGAARVSGAARVWAARPDLVVSEVRPAPVVLGAAVAAARRGYPVGRRSENAEP